MAFSSTIYYTPGVLSWGAMAASSTHVVAIDGNSPRNKFAVFTLSSNTSQVYSLPSGTSYATDYNGIVYSAGAFWFNYDNYLGRIDPSGWSFTKSPYAYGHRGSLTVVGSWIYGATHRYNTSTDTYSSHARSGTSWGTVSGRLFMASGTTLTEVDPDTAAVVDTWTLPYTAYLGGVTVGTRLYFTTQLTGQPFVWFDASTDTVGSLPASPPLSGGMTIQWVAHSDGYLYGLTSEWGRALIVFDPATSLNYIDYPYSAAPTDDYRAIVSTGGKLYTVSPGPVTWP